MNAKPQPPRPLNPVEEAIFHAAGEMTPPEARSAFLDRACAGDPALRQRIEALLEANARAGQFFADDPLDLEQPPASISPAPITVQDAPDERMCGFIGRYKLLQRIGEGGCGVVYMAEQSEPIKRRVALKVIKLGMDTRSVIARFEAERQALALMDHPNIAKVLDAGATDTGRPYFVMELVRGTKITEYCDEAKLPTRERLDLFVQVCHAVQHAHQKGIIHRDLKPSNILVTVNDGVPVPKVIDFGIAKATHQQQLTDKTLFTAFEQFIGTPAYMSPEQAVLTSVDIDTRTDIYSLGVLLYETLTGKTPLDAKELLSLGLDEMRRAIREKEPVRPSTRLSAMFDADLTTTAKMRRIEAPKLIHQLRGDLDWIVMKCLEKDRTRRYETASGLASDVQRHLNNEAVLARPPSAAYRFQKLVRRNRLAFAAASAVVFTLLAGLAFSTWAFLREAAQRRIAVQQRSIAVAAQASEAQQRSNAETQRNAAVRQRKLADMQLALQAWEEGDLSRANDLIGAGGPAPGEAPSFEWRYLRKLCQDQSIEPFKSQKHPYRSAQFFNRNLILLNDEKTLTLVDLSNRIKELLIEDSDGIWCPTFCPGNTNLLATATEDGRVKVWNIAAKRLHVEFQWHSRSSIKCIVFSPDGKWLASASGGNSNNSDNSIKLWDVESRNPKPHRNVCRYSVTARAVLFSPDGRQLFTGGSESMIRAWDVPTGTEIPAPFEGHTGWGYTLANSPDGLRMASSSGDSTVIVWNILSRKLEWRLVGHIAGATALAFSPDGQILASGSTDHTIRLWDMRTGQQLSLLRGHGSVVRSLSFSPDGQLLVSRSDDDLVKLWPVAGLDGNTFNGSPEWRQDVAVSPDGRYIASVAIDTFAVNLWELPSRKLTILTGHSNTVMCAAFSPDGKMLATGSHDQTVRLWDVSNHQPIDTLVNRFPVGSLAFSPDGRTLIVGGSSWSFLNGDQGGLEFWDVPSLRPTGTIHGDPSDIVELTLSASGSLLATGHKEGAVSLWDAKSRRLLHGFESQFGIRVISLTFSPTEPVLAASDQDGNIMLYNTANMEVVRPPLKAHTWRVMSLAFSPDGRTLASAGEGGGLKLWNLAARQVALTLKGHTGSVTGVAFSRDGSFLASCGADGTVRLWPAPNFAERDAAVPVRAN